MKKRILAAVLSIVLSCTVLCTPAWAYGPLADVAYNEYALGMHEEPEGSDCILYNEWYYGSRVSNTYDHGSYIQQYNWNATFACWCAEQLNYLMFARFPRSSNAQEMYQWFVDRDYKFYTPSNVVGLSGDVRIEPGDVIFYFAGSGNREIGIITQADASSVSFLAGDKDGTIQLTHWTYNTIDASTVFVKIIPMETGNLSEIALFLRQDMQLNPAAVCGILTNIVYESGGSSVCYGDSATSFGICQWHNERFTALIDYCDQIGADWGSLYGQLQFLRYELENQYKGLLDMINSSPNTPEGAYEAAYLFCVDFERPDDTEKKADIRGADAQQIYYPIWFG